MGHATRLLDLRVLLDLVGETHVQSRGFLLAGVKVACGMCMSAWESMGACHGLDHAGVKVACGMCMSVWESMGAWYGFIVRGLDKFVCGVVGTKGPSACRALAKPKPFIHSPLMTWKTPETSTRYPRTSHIVLLGLVHGRCNQKKIVYEKMNVK